MRRFFGRMICILALLGIDLPRLFRSARELPWFLGSFRSFRRMAHSAGVSVRVRDLHPCLHDRRSDAGSVGGHYFWQDLWVAQEVFKEDPEVHVDVGSRIDGFVAHVASFRPITVLDVRPLTREVPNVRFHLADLMVPDPGREGMADSVSSLHVVEHFGLGRYGDALSLDGHLRGIRNLCGLVRPGGRLYLGFPTGEPRIAFNAHRVLSVEEALEGLADDFGFEKGLLVSDEERVVEFTQDSLASLQSEAGLQQYGCAVLCLRRDR